MIDRTPSPRRTLLIRCSALAASALALAPARSRASPAAAEALLRQLSAATPVRGRVHIDAPEIAENGNAVPIAITVDSPMTDQDFVRALHVVAEGNPSPGVVSFRFAAASGKADVQFRTRLAATQRIVAVAEMSDGSSWTAAREIKVALGGCGG